jgi:hypothetical protein
MQAQRMSQRIGLAIAVAIGWQVQVQPPPARCVVIGAPHTSGWDLPLTLLLMLAANLKLRWICVCPGSTASKRRAASIGPARASAFLC